MLATCSAWFCVGSLVSCSTETEAGCTGNSNCPRGEFCRASTGECAALADNSFAGSFDCVPDVVGSAPTEAFQSDVVGKLHGRDISFNAVGVCVLEPDSITFGVYAGDDTTLAWNTTDPQPVNQIEPFNLFNATFGYVGPINTSGDTAPVELFLTEGTYTLDRRPEIGQRLRVYIEASGQPPATQPAAGVPCPTGTECGAYWRSGAYCAEGESGSLCYADCASSADCAAYGADLCASGNCFRSCEADAECGGSLRCLTVGEGKACY